MGISTLFPSHGFLLVSIKIILAFLGFSYRYSVPYLYHTPYNQLINNASVLTKKYFMKTLGAPAEGAPHLPS